MKKLLALLLAATMVLALAACGDKNAPPPEGEDGGEPTASYKIAIVKQMDHASLDEISNAIEAELEALAKAENIALTCKVFSGQNDGTVLNQIGSQIIGDEYDAIIPIATTAAQSMMNAAEESKTPVIFAAISDPEAAGLVGVDYVTGVSDALDTELIMNMMLAQNPELKTVGLLYSTSEPNSKKSIEVAKAFLDAKGISYIEKTGNTNDEINNASVSMMNQVQAIFTPTDNVVMAAELTIAELFNAVKVPHYTGADSFVRNGAFATCGVNYTELGKTAAAMTLDVLKTGTIPAYKTMEGKIITVNTETATAIGADYSMFASMGEELVEVITSED